MSVAQVSDLCIFLPPDLPMLAIALNDLRLLFRDKGACFFTFFFPVLFAIFFTFVFGGGSGGGGKMKVAVLDLDQTKASQRLVSDIEADDALESTSVAARPAGEQLVQTSKVSALIIIPKGFDEGANGLFTGGKIPLEAVVDPSRSAEAGLLTGKLNELAFRQLSAAFTDQSRMKDLLAKSREQLKTFADAGSPRESAFLKFFDGADALSGQLDQLNKDAAPEPAPSPDKDAKKPRAVFSPVDVSITKLEPDAAPGEKKSPRAASDFSFPQGIAWGLMGSVVGFAASIAAERRRGTLIRLATSPLSRKQILAGKALACLLTCLLVQAALIAVAVAMGSRPASWPLLAMAIACSSLGFVGLAMGLAPFADSEEGASGLARAVPMILAMIGGGTIPLFIMPPIVAKISGISPFSWAIYAVEGALWRNLSLAQMALPCGILLAIGAVCFTIGALRLRWE